MAAEEILSDVSMGGSSSTAAKKDEAGSAAAAAATVGGRRGKERVEINLNADLNADALGVGRWNGEGLEGQDHGFQVGDLVWGKIKPHPWWPGQIYDPRDASDFAMKHRMEGRVLVAFFGDGSCSWCQPSQLIPFVENLELMSSESSSKSSNAVQKAVDEIARVVEVSISCKCIQLEKRVRLSRPMVSNFGVKAGVLVPEVDLRRIPIPEFEPSKILGDVIRHAKSASFDNLFELAVLKSRVSAFAYAKFGAELCEYRDPPLVIEGLEERISDLNSPMNGPEVDDDPVSPKVVSATNDPQMKKQKSVSEIMGKKNAAVKTSKSRSGVEKRTRKRREEVTESRERADCKMVLKKEVEDMLDSNNGENAVKTSKSRSGDEKRTRKRKEEVTESRERADCRMVSKKEVEGMVDSDNGFSPRERKKSKYLSPPYTTSIRKGTKYASMKLEQEVDKLVNPTTDSEDRDFSAFLFDENLNEDNVKKMTFSPSDVDMEVLDVVLKIQSAAVDPLYLRKEGHLDSIWDFASAYRSSTYVQGSDYKVFKFKKGSHKRKSMATPSKSRPRQCSAKISSRRKRHAGESEPWSSPSDGLVSDARAIGEKLDLMAKDLETYGSRFSSEEKTCLKDAMKALMEKVEIVNEKVRPMAENASS